MADYFALACAWHSNASDDAKAAWERLDRTSRTLEGREHRFCREYEIVAEGPSAAFTATCDRFISDAVDARLYAPDRPIEIKVVQR